MTYNNRTEGGGLFLVWKSSHFGVTTDWPTGLGHHNAFHVWRVCFYFLLFKHNGRKVKVKCVTIKKVLVETLYIIDKCDAHVACLTMEE